MSKQQLLADLKVIGGTFLAGVVILLMALAIMLGPFLLSEAIQAAKAEKFVWPNRKALEEFCRSRPFFRDCHNLRDPRWSGDGIAEPDARCWNPKTYEWNCEQR